jgi:hypothetical protein
LEVFGRRPTLRGTVYTWPASENLHKSYREQGSKIRNQVKSAEARRLADDPHYVA